MATKTKLVAIVVIIVIAIVALIVGLSLGIKSENTCDRGSNEIPVVTDIAFTSTRGGILITYKRPADLEECSIRYIINVITEDDVLRYITGDVNVTIPEDTYCTKVMVHIIAIVDGSYSYLPAFRTHWHTLEAIEGLELHPSAENRNKLIVSWSAHSKAHKCPLSYRVTYTVGSEINVKETPSLTTSFDIIYCEYAMVYVTAFSVETQITSTLLAKNATLEPISIGKVQNVEMDVTGTTASISWALPDNMKQCTISYTVRAINDNNSKYEDECVGHKNCELNLQSFCPSTTFTITATNIPGELVEEKYICSSGLQII